MSTTLQNHQIAPCGMNCALCSAFQRDKNTCHGCRIKTGYKAQYCTNCIIANCDKLDDTELNFCYNCKDFPCKRLKQLNTRYVTKYNMSMIDNLTNINEYGLDQFILMEQLKWTCSKCGKLICVHRGCCNNCNKN
jgi:hypothetical protein